MPIGLIARKLGMSRVFLPSGEVMAVTYLHAPDNTIIRMKTKEKDGYNAVVLGIDQRLLRTRKGRELTKHRNQKEFAVDSLDGFRQGGTVNSSMLAVDSRVTITATSKGKGFQGVIKRYHFAGGPASHGSHFKREPGSVGMRTWPGRIHKGKRMPGRMGADTVTVRHRPVIVADAERKIIGVKGPVPGHNGTVVTVTLESV